jgi:thioredoxin reductase (NADPH)
VIEKEATGGQAGTSSRIENYLGFPQGLSGVDLARRATIQATRLGAEILTAQEATQIRVEDPYLFVTLSDGTELSCHALLIASGMTVRKPDVPGIFAAGDVRHGVVRRVASAVGQGAVAVSFIHKYLETV